MIRTVIAFWLYATSLIALACSAFAVQTTLEAFPSATQLVAYGPHVPAFSRTFAGFAPHVPVVLGALAALSVLGVVYFWRKRDGTGSAQFATAAIAGFNLAVSCIAATHHLVAFFMLPKLANSAV